MIKIEAPNTITGSDPKIYVHGSTLNRIWRNQVEEELASNDIIILDPWRSAWDDYISSYGENLESAQDIQTSIINETTFNAGTGVADGSSVPTFPDIQFFWEDAAVKDAEFGVFVFDDQLNIPTHVLLQMVYFLQNKKATTFIQAPVSDWRINISFFLTKFTDVNFYSSFDNLMIDLKKAL